MSEVTYQVDAGTLAAGACPSTYQELADLLASIYSVTVSTNNTGIVVSATKPADTTVVWKQLDSSLRPVRDYIFVGGLWLSRHTLEPGSIMLWEGDISTINSFDGGNSDPVSAVSGPMWERVTELNAKFPLGVGTFPSGTVIANGDTGGEENHVLISNELAKHQHNVWPADGGDGNTSMEWSHFDAGGESCNPGLSKPLMPTDDCGSGKTTIVAQSQTDGGAGHNNIPPYYALYFIRRTVREFFVVP